MTPTLDEQIEWAETIAETADERFACPEVFHAILATLRSVKQAEPVAAPDGWVLVPKEPTEAMIGKGNQRGCDYTSDRNKWNRWDELREIWRGMLAATPAAAWKDAAERMK